MAKQKNTIKVFTVELGKTSQTSPVLQFKTYTICKNRAEKKQFYMWAQRSNQMTPDKIVPFDIGSSGHVAKHIKKFQAANTVHGFISVQVTALIPRKSPNSKA